MEPMKEGLLSTILKMLSGMNKTDFSKAEKDIKKWKEIKKKLEKGTPQDRLLLKKILKQTKLR
tara:strand:+ start:831 stop:1019 length:189 start_codon:yes stop_codon:yes gene_type:complete